MLQPLGFDSQYIQYFYHWDHCISRRKEGRCDRSCHKDIGWILRADYAAQSLHKEIWVIKCWTKFPKQAMLNNSGFVGKHGIYNCHFLGSWSFGLTALYIDFVGKHDRCCFFSCGKCWPYMYGHYLTKYTCTRLLLLLRSNCWLFGCVSQHGFTCPKFPRFVVHPWDRLPWCGSTWYGYARQWNDINFSLLCTVFPQ